MPMSENPEGFYEALAAHYHLIFEDWSRSIEKQAGIFGPLLSEYFPAHPLKILDCACGIGTQALGFAAMGHRVVASDLSGAAVKRARKEAQCRSLDVSFHVSDMTSLGEIEEAEFDVVAALDNALPHLSADGLKQAAAAIKSKLRAGGILMASIRDYDAIIEQRPSVQEPAFYGSDPNRRIVHQVWNWVGSDRYVVHLYIAVQAGPGWETHHFVTEYRCLLRGELTSALKDAGFASVRWLMPDQSGFYQPLVMAKR